MSMTFFTFSDNHRLRGHSQKLVVPKSRLNCRKYGFSTRVVPIWNSLPQGAIDCRSVPSFKRFISSIDFSQFLRYSDWSLNFVHKILIDWLCFLTMQGHVSIYFVNLCVSSVHAVCSVLGTVEFFTAHLVWGESRSRVRSQLIPFGSSTQQCIRK